MPKSTPEETFAEARSAMERGDWDGVFACLVRDNLLKIVENGIGRFIGAGEITPDGYSEDVGFVKRKDGWYVHLFARRRN